MSALDTFTADTYYLRKKVMKMVGGAFHLRDASGNLIAYSEQKAFKLKEDIRIFADEAKSKELLSIQARKRLDISSAYDVTDSVTGEKVGAVQRKGMKSMLRDEWHFFDANEAITAVLVEDSMALAVVRRLLTTLIPQRYDVLQPDLNGKKVASLHGNFNPFVYKLEVKFDGGVQSVPDRRLIIAAAMLLAAIEGKQE
jgi:uncharacterized protein YxjI